VTEHARTLDRWNTVAILIAIGVVVALQLFSLFVFPLSNSLRWYGDESWLMSEVHSQITTGIVRYPLALGSTLEHSKGLVLSMTWLSSLLYGLPTAITNADPVSIGRFVTAALSVTLLAALFFCARRLGASSFAAAFATLMLVCTRSFFFSSHSCRTDILAGLIVLLFIWKMLRITGNRSARWWFGYGAIVAFLCVSSSIHLLTLLGPVALYFAWRRGAFTSVRTIIALLAGGVLMIALLAATYALTTGSLSLFSPHAHQFGDVLSSIPILRPFSRSVQIANVVIRTKEFWAEAPIALLAMAITGLAAWRREINKELAIATLVVFLSWLFLEGTEINYLIHVLPLLFLCLSIALTQLFRRTWHVALLTVFVVIAVIFSTKDALVARSNAVEIDRSNALATEAIAHKIASTWEHTEAPLVLSEPPSLAQLSKVQQIRVMTDHFISLPEREEPIDSSLSRLHVAYAVLYNSPTFPKHREEVDSLYRGLMRRGTVIDREVGTTGDIGRSYFDRSGWRDTLILIKLNDATTDL
jgi:hypothetical protein